MPNIRLKLEYDGTPFYGWQQQPGKRTVQGELHRVLELVLREKIKVVHASGRTDAGVHARSQVVNFHVSAVPDLAALQHSVSSLLRPDLAVLDAAVVADDFHSRYHAVAKQYSYLILNRRPPAVLDKRRVWHIRAPLNLERMQCEAAVLEGEHDFSSVRAIGCASKSAVKFIRESHVWREGDYVHYRVVGSGFLKQMVRAIVGTLVEFGRGERTGSMRAILEARDRSQAGITAPACGLYLDWVEYPG